MEVANIGRPWMSAEPDGEHRHFADMGLQGHKGRWTNEGDS